MLDDERWNDEDVWGVAERLEKALKHEREVFEQIRELERMMELRGPKNHIEGKRRGDLWDLLNG